MEIRNIALATNWNKKGLSRSSKLLKLKLNK